MVDITVRARTYLGPSCAITLRKPRKEIVARRPCEGVVKTRHLMRMMMMYLGRCTDGIVLLIADCRTSVRELLFFGWRTPLRETLETLERVVYEDPVFVYHFTVLG